MTTGYGRLVPFQVAATWGYFLLSNAWTSGSILGWNLQFFSHNDLNPGIQPYKSFRTSFSSNYQKMIVAFEDMNAIREWK
jgi:hypothetical protein